MKPRSSLAVLATAATLALAAAACGSSGGSSSKSAGGTTSTTASSAPVTLRLGYFPNLTHASALVGVKEGIFAKDLGANVTIQYSTFTSGTPEEEALLSGSLDAGYMGPNPAITGYTQSGGQALRVISGATSGGAGLVVQPSITSAAQLKGQKVADPQLGNTQDVALRHWLAGQGLTTNVNGGGDVSVLPEANSTTVTAFETNQIAGAWVPEPYLTELVKAGGHELVNEASLWPGGKFATTLLVVSTTFLKAHPDVVHRLLEAQVDANDFIAAHPAQAQADADAQIAAITGKPLKQSVVTAAWSDMTFTDNPIASSLLTDASRAAALGFPKASSNLVDVFDLGPLNQVLKAKGEATVSS